MKKTILALLLLIAAAALAGPGLADSLLADHAYLPAVHIVGATGIYVSDVSLFNPSTSPVEVRFFFTPADTDGSALPGFRLNPDLQGRETFTIQDILTSVFNVTSTYGLLEVRASAPIIVTGNAINVAQNCTGGTFGQFNPGQPLRNAVAYGTTTDYDLYVTGVPYDSVHRTNAVVLNPTALTLHATMELIDASANNLGHVDVDVPPYSLHQINDVFRVFAGANPRPDPSYRLNFWVNANNGALLLAYATITDVWSGDPYLVTASAQREVVPQTIAPPAEAASRTEPLAAVAPARRSVLDVLPIPARQ